MEDLHKGRVRSFPHVRGNWATFVFIPSTSQRKGGRGWSEEEEREDEEGEKHIGEIAVYL